MVSVTVTFWSPETVVRSEVMSTVRVVWGMAEVMVELPGTADLRGWKCSAGLLATATEAMKARERVA